jgi:hypothetical protein
VDYEVFAGYLGIPEDELQKDMIHTEAYALDVRGIVV